MEMRIKREETRRSITVLFVTLNKKTHTVSALSDNGDPIYGIIY